MSPPLSRAVRSNSRARRHRKRARRTGSHPGDAIPSVPRKARYLVTNVTLPSGYDDSGFFADALQKLIYTTLRRVSTHMSFFATIVQDNRPVPVFSYRLSMALIERALGDAGHIECPAIMPLALNSWLVVGFLNKLHDASGLTVDQEATQNSSISTTTHRYIPRRNTSNTENFLSTDDEQSSDDEISSNEGSSAGKNMYSSEEEERLSIKGKKI
jgi:hypothetical protein